MALTLIAGTAGLLQHAEKNRTLAPPGVKTHLVPGSIRLQADLPEQVLDYHSEEVEVDKVTLATLPNDTSFGMRRYKAADGFAP